MSKHIQGLNPAQRQAVEATAGPVLVLAGPGSGKTRVLTHRIAYLINEAGVDPFHILAVTFTNKAAREMKDRLHALIGPDAAQVLSAGTFHSLCARFLRKDIVHLGRERDFAIYDADDQLRLMRRVLRDLKLDEKQHPPRAILGQISSAKNELVSPQEYARLNRTYFGELVTRCYERYQALLRESHALDFDDLLVETVRLFDEHPEVLARYQDRYTYLLVDEYQDTNRVQYLLVRQLALRHRNLFVVGDDDQSIYQFRGADVRNIRSFEVDYPEAQVILLEQNYRSTQAILDTAQAIINAGDKQRHLKRLWTDNDQGLDVALYEGFDQEAEAGFVVDEIARLVATGEVTPGGCAVMYRTNAQSRPVEEALIRRGLAYQIVGGMRFYDRKEIKDVIAYLRLIVNPFDSVSFSRVLNWPGRGIGERTEAELMRWAMELGVPVFQALRELETGSVVSPLNARSTSALLGFLALIDELSRDWQERPLTELMDTLLARVGVRQALEQEYGAEAAEDRWRNIEELRSVSTEYINLPTEAQLPTFLEEVALVADVDRFDAEADAITCITLHQAKGLEFPVVFLIGLEDGLLPHSRSLDTRDQIEEERRLLYVGITRARQRLYLCYAFKRMQYGRSTFSARSRFLADIPRELLKQPQGRIGTNQPTAQTSMFTKRSGLDRQPEQRIAKSGQKTAPVVIPANRSGSKNTRTQRPVGPTEVSFFAGQRVRHATFGEGVVISSRLVEGDEEVTVSFPDRERRLLASFARLERVTEA